jgi:hypothetical protein
MPANLLHETGIRLGRLLSRSLAGSSGGGQDSENGSRPRFWAERIAKGLASAGDSIDRAFSHFARLLGHQAAGRIHPSSIPKIAAGPPRLCSIYNTRILSIGKRLRRTKMQQLGMDSPCRCFLRCS